MRVEIFVAVLYFEVGVIGICDGCFKKVKGIVSNRFIFE